MERCVFVSRLGRSLGKLPTPHSFWASFSPTQRTLNVAYFRYSACMTYFGKLGSSLEAAVSSAGRLTVKGGDKVYHCGGGIVYHRHDEKEVNWEPGGVRNSRNRDLTYFSDSANGNAPFSTLRDLQQARFGDWMPPVESREVRTELELTRAGRNDFMVLGWQCVAPLPIHPLLFPPDTRTLGNERAKS